MKMINDNDKVMFKTYKDYILFADDALLMIKDRNLKNAIRKMQEDIIYICGYVE